MSSFIITLLVGTLIAIAGLVLVSHAARKRETPSENQLPLLKVKNGVGLCPDCDAPALVSGPSGGLAVNVACSNCYHEFNFFGMNGKVYIEESRGRMPPGRAAVYDLPEKSDAFFDTDTKMMSNAE